MPKWTQSVADERHLAKVSQAVPIAGIAVFRMGDGSEVEGIIRRFHAGNNGGERGWRYYGECEIQSIDGNRHVLDFLDIKEAKQAPESRVKAYEKAGLITIRK